MNDTPKNDHKTVARVIVYSDAHADAEKELRQMPRTNSIIRRSKPKHPKARCLFVLQQDLLNEIREVASANDISVSHLLREGARRQIKAYRGLVS